MVTDVKVGEFKSKLRGQLLMPGDEGYEIARKVYNGMIDRRPRWIARCFNVADVISSVHFARDNDILVAIRGGGHNAGGLGICEGGMVIDLSLMRSVRVNPAKRTARAEGGCTGADLDHATHAFGLATPTGTVASTGIAGLTLGGGIGHLSRPYGLTIDNLLAVDVVLADGSFVTASAEENQDLYWAVRGGGGNFGVVTSFLYRLHPVKMVSAGPTFWPLDQAPQVMKAYREFITQAPEDISGFFAFLTVPPVPLFPPDLHGKRCAQSSGARQQSRRRQTRQPSPCAQSASRRSITWARCLSRRSRAFSTPSSRPDCSGTGGRISSRKSATHPSPRTLNTRTSFPPAFPRCTCIPSTVRFTVWPTPTPLSAIATVCWRESSWASTQTPKQQRKDHTVDKGLLRRAAPVLSRGGLR